MRLLMIKIYWEIFFIKNILTYYINLKINFNIQKP